MPLIWREEGSTARSILMDMFKERGITPSIAYEASNVEFIKKLAISGEGLHFVSRKGIEEEFASGVLTEIRLEGVHLVMDTSVVYLKHLKLSKIATEFSRCFSSRPHLLSLPIFLSYEFDDAR